ncbi:multisubunit Na+/H+ antiporter MnhF subunit [Sphingomonas sp. F9_3S_D5_B_2]
MEVRTGTAAQRRATVWSIGKDAPWLLVMAAVTALELIWWVVTWSRGFAPAPHLGTYLAITFAGLGAALVLRLVLQGRAARPNWRSVLLATFLVGAGASLFLPLKYAIPSVLPFWLDAPLAHAEQSLFTVDPWLLLDRSLGWAVVPMDWIYALWLPAQAIVLFMVLLQPASATKSRVVIAYVLGWFLLGVVAALAFSSAGPIFYDRLSGGTHFAPLREALEQRGAWFVIAESDLMWSSMASGRPSLVAGISAVPSIHVAISAWMFLASRAMAPRAAPFALVYTILVWVGSVQLGWHYATDGLAGVVGMVAVWALSPAVQRTAEAALSQANPEEPQGARRPDLGQSAKQPGGTFEQQE